MTSDQMISPISSELVAGLLSLAWSTFVGEVPEEVEPAEIGEDVVCAAIAIGGPWSAMVLLFCGRGLAATCATAVLGVPSEELTDDDLHDVIGELVNIIGGNLKGIVGDTDGAWTLSLPAVANGMQTVPGGRLAAEVHFRCNGALLGCEVREHD